jgi:hypothetical protein
LTLIWFFNCKYKSIVASEDVLKMNIPLVTVTIKGANENYVMFHNLQNSTHFLALCHDVLRNDALYIHNRGTLSINTLSVNDRKKGEKRNDCVK